MITYKEAEKIILASHNDSVIVSAYKIPSGYIFSLQPKDWEHDMILGGYFKVSGENGVISEYSPVMDTKEFAYAMAHPMYRR